MQSRELYAQPDQLVPDHLLRVPCLAFVGTANTWCERARIISTLICGAPGILREPIDEEMKGLQDIVIRLKYSPRPWAQLYTLGTGYPERNLVPASNELRGNVTYPPSECWKWASEIIATVRVNRKRAAPNEHQAWQTSSIVLDINMPFQFLPSDISVTIMPMANEELPCFVLASIVTLPVLFYVSHDEKIEIKQWFQSNVEEETNIPDEKRKSIDISIPSETRSEPFSATAVPAPTFWDLVPQLTQDFEWNVKMDLLSYFNRILRQLKDISKPLRTRLDQLVTTAVRREYYDLNNLFIGLSISGTQLPNLFKRLIYELESRFEKVKVPTEAEIDLLLKASLPPAQYRNDPRQYLARWERLRNWLWDTYILPQVSEGEPLHTFLNGFDGQVNFQSFSATTSAIIQECSLNSLRAHLLQHATCTAFGFPLAASEWPDHLRSVIHNFFKLPNRFSAPFPDSFIRTALIISLQERITELLSLVAQEDHDAGAFTNTSFILRTLETQYLSDFTILRSKDASNRFTVEKNEIGHGAFAVAHRAIWHRFTGVSEPVVLKISGRGGRNDYNFAHEVHFTRLLSQYPQFPQCRGAIMPTRQPEKEDPDDGLSDKMLLILEEFDCNLWNYWNSLSIPERTPWLTLWVLREICHSILLMHNHGIMHRDIKLDNFLVKLSPDKKKLLRVVLADFGLATDKQLSREPVGCHRTSFVTDFFFSEFGYDKSIDVKAVAHIIMTLTKYLPWYSEPAKTPLAKSLVDLKNHCDAIYAWDRPDARGALYESHTILLKIETEYETFCNSSLPKTTLEAPQHPNTTGGAHAPRELALHANSQSTKIFPKTSVLPSISPSSSVGNSVAPGASENTWLQDSSGASSSHSTQVITRPDPLEDHAASQDEPAFSNIPAPTNGFYDPWWQPPQGKNDYNPGIGYPFSGAISSTNPSYVSQPSAGPSNGAAPRGYDSVRLIPPLNSLGTYTTSNFFFPSGFTYTAHPGQSGIPLRARYDFNSSSSTTTASSGQSATSRIHSNGYNPGVGDSFPEASSSMGHSNGSQSYASPINGTVHQSFQDGLPSSHFHSLGISAVTGGSNRSSGSANIARLSTSEAPHMSPNGHNSRLGAGKSATNGSAKGSLSYPTSEPLASPSNRGPERPTNPSAASSAPNLRYPPNSAGPSQPHNIESGNPDDLGVGVSLPKASSSDPHPASRPSSELQFHDGQNHSSS
jgi:serine/threonine protein kinase